MRATEDQLKAWMVGGLGGDADAHATLLRAIVPLLRTFFARRLHKRDDDIEDLVQEVLIAVHTRRATFDRGLPFTAWLYAIARYRLVDHFRRRRVTAFTDDLDTIPVTDGFENAASAQMDVNRLLSSLPAKQARAIRDTHIEGYSVAEAAQAAQIGESDVKVSVHRGLKALATRFRRQA